MTTLLSLSFLDNVTSQQVKDLTPEQLQALKAELDAALSLLKRRKQVLDAGIKLKYFVSAQEALRATKRDTGTVKIYDGHQLIVAELPKSVAWDQNKLASIIAAIPEVQRPPAIKTLYAINERQYKDWSLQMKTLFQPARTVTIGTPSFRFKEGDAQ